MKADQLIGHRGCMLLTPENTAAGFLECLNYGVRWIETDVNLLGDGTPVIFHDDTLARLTGDSRHLKDLSVQDLGDLDVGSHFSPRFSAERIPTLHVLLELLWDAGMSLNLEIKKHAHYSARQITSAVLEDLRRHWKDHDRLLITSFDRDVLRLVREDGEDWQIGLLCESLPEDLDELHRDLRFTSINPHARLVSEGELTSLKVKGLSIYVYTVNDREQAERLLAMGVDKVITDDPHVMTTEKR